MGMLKFDSLDVIKLAKDEVHNCLHQILCNNLQYNIIILLEKYICKGGRVTPNNKYNLEMINLSAYLNEYNDFLESVIHVKEKLFGLMRSLETKFFYSVVEKYGRVHQLANNL